MSQSNAMTRLDSTVGMAESLLGIEKTYPSPPPTKDSAVVEGLRGGALVLLVAGFEAFLRELCTEQLDSLTSEMNEVRFADLPDEFRIHTVFETLNRAMRGAPHQKAGTKKDRLPGVIAACAMVVGERINPRVFADTGGNPSPETVREMFKAVGVSDVFAVAKRAFVGKRRWNAPVADTFIASKLQEIVDKRHVIAHKGQVLNVTRRDLREYIRFVRVLAGVLESVMVRHVEGLKRVTSPSS